MRKMRMRVLALILAAALVLSGCAVDFGGYLDGLRSMMAGDSIVPYSSMQYERPDLTQLDQALAEACEAATGEDADAIMEAVCAFYDAYDWFYTCYSLADIRYCGDLTDTYWEKEYNWCVENSATVDAALEALYYALAQSPVRGELEQSFFGEGFFDGYEGENLWDEEFTALLEAEANLQSQYYALSEEALNYAYGTAEYYDACADDMAQLLVDLIALRQEIAAYWGYTDYTRFASDFSYYRDYTTAQVEAYLDDIRQALVAQYRELEALDVWDVSDEYCRETKTLDYMRTAAKNMGGTVQEAFDLLDKAGLYDIGYGENKYNSSYEVYLTSYWEPFIFMNSTLTAYDKRTFAHEFGHFCNDYACWGSVAGVDVMEAFSQGMEYQSLCYGEDTEELTKGKLADSLCTYVEQAAFASFEQEMYGLTGDALTVENLYALYDGIARDFGFDSMGYDRREFVDITHFYTNPMYIISYVVSNDAAMQLYQLEQETTGAGLTLFEENLATQEAYFLSFLDSAGLESPVAEGRIREVRETFEEGLK